MPCPLPLRTALLLCGTLASLTASLARGEWRKLDDFNHTAPSPDQPPSLWAAANDTAAFRATTEVQRPGNGFLATRASTKQSLGYLSYSRPMGFPNPVREATYFFRFRLGGTQGGRILTHLVLGGEAAEVLNQQSSGLRLTFEGGFSAVTLKRTTRYGTGEVLSGIQADRWLAVWVVCNLPAKRYALYIAPDDAPKATAEFLLDDQPEVRGPALTDALHLIVKGASQARRLDLDDFYIDPNGANLTNPTAAAPADPAPKR